jgi:hypothetical protein
LTGEFAELLLGIVFVADVVERRGRAHGGGSARLGAILQVGALAGAVLISPLTDRIVYRNAARLVPIAQQELQALQNEITYPGVIQARLFKKRRVHKRIFTAATSGRYLATAREDYFLDPWNQAYWIAYHRVGKGTGRVLLYSFGPNRRRDSDISLLGTPTASLSEIAQDDDVGVLFGVRSTTSDDR